MESSSILSVDDLQVIEWQLLNLQNNISTLNLGKQQLNEYQTEISKIKLIISKVEDIVEKTINQHPKHSPSKHLNDKNFKNKFSKFLGLGQMKLISQGGFADIYLVNGDDNNPPYIVKKIKDDKLSFIDREVRALQMISDANCRYSNHLRDYGSDYLELDYVKGRTLHDYIKEEFPKGLTNNLIFFFFIQIYYGVCELHSIGIVHMDLKLENILLDEDKMEIRIIDFSMPIFIDDEITADMSICKTANYVSPELLYDFNYLETSPWTLAKNDVYSLGIILYYFNFQKLPFEAERISKDKFIASLERMTDEIKDSPTQLKNLLPKMLEYENTKRIKLLDITNEKWIQDKTKSFRYLNKSTAKHIFNRIIT